MAIASLVCSTAFASVETQLIQARSAYDQGQYDATIQILYPLLYLGKSATNMGRGHSSKMTTTRGVAHRSSSRSGFGGSHGMHSMGHMSGSHGMGGMGHGGGRGR